MCVWCCKDRNLKDHWTADFLTDESRRETEEAKLIADLEKAWLCPEFRQCLLKYLSVVCPKMNRALEQKRLTSISGCHRKFPCGIPVWRVCFKEKWCLPVSHLLTGKTKPNGKLQKPDGDQLPWRSMTDWWICFRPSRSGMEETTQGEGGLICHR